MTERVVESPAQGLFLISSSGNLEEALAPSIADREVRRFRTVRHFLDDAASSGSGCVLLPGDVGAKELRMLLTALAERTGPWVPVLLQRTESGGDGTLTATPLSLGFPESVEDLLERLFARGDAGTVARAPLLELRTVLAEVSRTRHDINNPLTAALAETQLLLLDIEEGEARDAVVIVEKQLRRIRDMVARLAGVRAPPPGKRSGA